MNIVYGCNNYCSYCVVPYTRGRERSRDYNEIISEVKNLGLSGFKEITLLGQNVNSYGNDFNNNYKFHDLLIALSEIESIDRIRFISSHPKDVTLEFIQVMKNSPKICNQIHLPIQSGSTKVLGEMNRKYTAERYIEIVEQLRNLIPNIAISTDIIVGFPGETEENFTETLDLISKVRFDSAFTFIYSIRPGTPAGKRKDQIDEKIKHIRFDKLLKTMYPIFEEKNKAYIGSTVEVLVDNMSKRNNDFLTGRTDTNKLVHFKGEKNLIGELVKVKIESAKTWFLEGSEIR